MTERARRVRVNRGGKQAQGMSTAETEHLTKLLDEYTKLESANVANNARMAELRDEAQKMMLNSTEKKFMTRKSVGEITVSKGRASNIVDAKKFYNAVKKDEFFDSISVSITKAKKVLGEKALKAITNTTHGKDGPPTLNIRARTEKDGK